MKKALYLCCLLIPILTFITCFEFILSPSSSEAGDFIYISNYDVFRFNMQTNLLEKITEDGAQNHYPFYMEELDKIGYRAGSPNRFALMNTDGSKQQIVFDFPASVNGLDYCSKTKKIFLYTLEGVRKLAVVDNNGENFTYLSNPTIYNDARPSINENGDQLLFMSDRSGVYQIYMLDLNSNIETQLTFGELKRNYPEWSDDENGFYFVEQSPNNFSILMYYDLGNNNVSKIAEFPGYKNFYFTLSPSENFVALTTGLINTSAVNLYIYDIENQSLEQKTFENIQFDRPKWYRFTKNTPKKYSEK